MITELAAPWRMSLPAVSKHIRILEGAGLIRREVDGRVHRCSLSALPLREAQQYLTRYRFFWEETLDSLARVRRAQAGQAEAAMTDPAMHRLEVRRVVHASVVRVFEAWTEPRHLRIWWGPRDVRCLDASVDLRVGGTYRIVNGMSDGAQVTIFGEFRVVEPPTRLVYTWRSGPGFTGQRACDCHISAVGQRHGGYRHSRFHFRPRSSRRTHEGMDRLHRGSEQVPCRE